MPVKHRPLATLCLALLASGCATSTTVDSGLPPLACEVNGITYDAGAIDPNNDCGKCEPLVSTTGFSPIGDGTVCDAGVCYGGVCVDDFCYIDETILAASTAGPGGDCLSCQPTVSQMNYSASPDGTPCTVDGGSYCQTGSCELLCLVDGGLYQPDASTPVPCQSCYPDTSITAFSPVLDITPCDAGGNFCRAGACVPACLIGDGGLLDAGTFPTDPVDDPSQCCSPSVSTSSLTPLFLTPSLSLSTDAPAKALASGRFNGPDSGLGLIAWDGVRVQVFLPNGAGGFGVAQTLVDTSAAAPAVADFDGDGRDDLALITNAGISFYLGQPSGIPLQSGLPIPAPDAGHLAAAHVYGTSYPDLAQLGTGVAPDVLVYENVSGVLQAGKSEAVLSSPGNDLVAGDFNGDGFDDLAVRTLNNVMVLTAANGGTVLLVDAGVLTAVSAVPTGLAVGHLSSAGPAGPFEDLAVTFQGTSGKSGTNEVNEYFGSLDGVSPAPNPMVLPAGFYVGEVVVAALSSLSPPALILPPTDGGVQVLLVLSTVDAGTPNFWASPGGLASAVVAGDFNQDQRTDLAVGLIDGGIVILWGQCL